MPPESPSVFDKDSDSKFTLHPWFSIPVNHVACGDMLQGPCLLLRWEGRAFGVSSCSSASHGVDYPGVNRVENLRKSKGRCAKQTVDILSCIPGRSLDGCLPSLCYKSVCCIQPQRGSPEKRWFSVLVHKTCRNARHMAKLSQQRPHLILHWENWSFPVGRPWSSCQQSYRIIGGLCLPSSYDETQGYLSISKVNLSISPLLWIVTLLPFPGLDSYK